jgi:hypothetical protein
MIDANMRALFGIAAFLWVGIVVALILSPFVPAEKETIANVILGNALGWPAIVLAFYFGSSSGSKEKSGVIHDHPSLRPGDPAHISEGEHVS